MAARTSRAVVDAAAAGPRHAASAEGRHAMPPSGAGRHQRRRQLPSGPATPGWAVAFSVAGVVTIAAIAGASVTSGSGERTAAAATSATGTGVAATDADAAVSVVAGSAVPASPGADAGIAAVVEPDAPEATMGSEPVATVVSGPVSAPRGRDADPEPEAGASTGAPTSTVGGIGAEHRVGGLVVTVESMRYLDAAGITGDGTRVAVALQVRRSAAGPGLTPSLELRCAATPDSGNYYADSTLSPGRELAAGGTVGGTVVLGLPGSLADRLCDGATVRITDPLDGGTGASLDVPVPAAVLAGP